MKHLLSMLALVLVCSPTQALNRYIRAGATAGANNGTSWADAWTNIADATFTRTNTFYIAGGTYTASTITPSSGSDRLVIKKANAADNSGDAGWSATYATDVALVNGQIIIGGGNLSIEGVTGSGTSGHGIKFVSTEDTGAVITVFATASAVSLSGLEVAGPGAGTSAFGNDLFTWNPVSSAQKGMMLSNCWWHGCTRNGLTIGRALGTSHTDYGLVIDGCVVSETGLCTDPGVHGQGIQLCYTSSSMQEHAFITIRNSTFRNITGSGYIAMIGNGFNHDFRFYNNVFYNNDVGTYTYCSPGVVNNNGTSTCSNIFMANLTFHGISGSTTNLAQVRFYSTSNTNITLQNCVWEDCYFSTTNIGTVQSNNGFFDNSGSGVPSGTTDQVDGASTTFVNAGTGDFRLLSTGYAVGQALDLSATFTTDLAGNTRSVPWDIGAYAYTTNSPLALSVGTLNVGTITGP